MKSIFFRYILCSFNSLKPSFCELFIYHQCDFFPSKTEIQKMSDVANLIQISYYFFAIRRFIKHKTL